MEITNNIVSHFRLVSKQIKALEKLGLSTIEDLLMYIPSRYEDVGNASNIRQLISATDTKETVVLYATIESVEKKLTWKTKRYLVEAELSDESGKIKVRWFNQPYISDSLKFAKYIKVTGKLTGSGASAYFANPTIEIMPGLPDVTEITSPASPYPIYKSTYGISSRWFYYAIRRILNTVDINTILDPVPIKILKKYNLPSISTAILWAHIPRHIKDSLSASKRFAFNEVFYLQVAAAQARLLRSAADTYQLGTSSENINDNLTQFIKSYPFTLTTAQANAIESIVNDMQAGKPMARLLEGDVGSGKTAVAAAVSFAVVTNKLQVSYMAPTEVLAGQLFDGFIRYFKNTNIQIGLLTGSGCKKYPSKTDPDKATKISKTQLLKWVADGSIDILIGTHAIIQKSVKFKHLALAIIDEQHRFGTRQRALMLQNNMENKIPHLLSMTATPIPRTLALTIYGDLDLSVIDEMPSGRKKVITKMVGANKMPEVYNHMRQQINEGRQVYVVCPRITRSDINDDDSPSIQKLMMARLKSVTEEVQSLQKIFPKLSIKSLHGKLKPIEKDNIMQEFADGNIDILVATSVVEVGINVPNATTILIEGAERFGLSQLHQLRGRVVRSNHQAYCYLATTSKIVSADTKERLSAIVKANNGFELAEMDLKLRGAGELRGDSQWGIGDITMEALQNIKMVEHAREEAKLLIREDPSLRNHPSLLSIITERSMIHLE